tara:strand:- start:196 stop:399 length:204 start_codon:yes stop_codon:yes gene_type:complete
MFKPSVNQPKKHSWIGSGSKKSALELQPLTKIQKWSQGHFQARRPQSEQNDLNIKRIKTCGLRLCFQ